ncbi:unnamed protein product [Lactuca virosa]|uniref:Replication factor A C-terminal domain-containing protein n=1 Tax=Lactuca virosa TaxID=75947 RepID=A0AAU9NCB0_9ASTR|nr:unnamed protein product [Lactuca virosa]
MHVLLQSERQVERPSVANIANMYSDIKKGVIEGTQYTVVGTIIDIDMFNDWKFIQCSRCYKNATFVDNRYFCSGCQKIIVNPRQVFKLVVEVADKDKEMRCVFFNEYATQLTGLTIGELVNMNLLEDDLHNVKDEGFSASMSEVNHTEYKDDDVGLFSIKTNVIESVSPKSATSTLTVICDNHQVDVSDKLIYKDGSGNMKDDAIVAPMYEVASNSNENDSVTKCVSEEKDVEDSDNVGDDTIQDDISKTPISICGLQDGGESEVGDDTIEDDMSKTPISICGLQDGGES